MDVRDDLLERLERVIDVQVEASNHIDSKSEHLTRLIGVVLGIIIGAISLSFENSSVSISDASLPIVIIFMFGGIFLLISLLSAIIAYFRTKIRYGPHSKVAETISKIDVAEEDYEKLLLRAYADAIGKNRKVIEKNNLPLGVSLITFILGLLYIFASILGFSLGTSSCPGWILLIVLIIISFILSLFTYDGGLEIDV